MKPWRGIKLQTLLLAIAIIGLALGGLFEWRNREARDRSAGGEIFALAEMNRHEIWLEFCRSRHRDRVPYDLGRNYEQIGYPSLSDFKSWSEEAEFHEGMAEEYRKRAREQAERKQYYQRRLLLP